MAIKARFKGDGSEFHFGIPARDLTDDDWSAMSKEDQNLVLASKLYNVVDKKDSTEADRAPFVRRVERASLAPEDVAAKQEEK